MSTRWLSQPVTVPRWAAIAALFVFTLSAINSTLNVAAWILRHLH